jgi:hypothetical protein
MNPTLQWGIPIVVGILTFFAGRAYERRAQAQNNRLKLLEPIEKWVDDASHLVGIVGEDVSAIVQGLPLPVGFDPQDRLKTSKALGERKDKILGILKSKALSTRGTAKQAKKLQELVLALSFGIERDYLQIHMRLLDKVAAKEDIGPDIMALLTATTALNSVVQEIHSCLATLKTRFN